MSWWDWIPFVLTAVGGLFAFWFGRKSVQEDTDERRRNNTPHQPKLPADLIDERKKKLDEIAKENDKVLVDAATPDRSGSRRERWERLSSDD